MLHVQVVTPEKVLLDDEADSIVIPTMSGEITVLPKHEPLVSQIASGVMLLSKNGKVEQVVVDGGFIQVTEKSVRILADYALHGKDISLVKAEEAKKQAEKAMNEKKSNVDFATAEAEFRRALLELKVARRVK